MGDNGIWSHNGLANGCSVPKPESPTKSRVGLHDEKYHQGYDAIFGQKKATSGHASSADYKATFFKVLPKLEGKVVVHHAVEQQTLTRFPKAVTEAQIHSLENLRGIPKAINSDVHLSQIRKSWNQFYKKNPSPTADQLLEHATVIDRLFGSQFRPRV